VGHQPVSRLSMDIGFCVRVSGVDSSDGFLGLGLVCF